MLNKLIFLIVVILFQLNLVYSNEFYILKNGDTLYGISKKYDTSLEEILRLNNLENITNLSVGTSIEIPNKQNNVNDNKTYIVKKGDTLFSISKKFSLTLSNIMEYNNLNKGDIISLGQVLRLTNETNEIDENEDLLLVEETEEILNESVEDVVNNDNISNSIPYWPINGNISKYSGRIQGVQIEGRSGEYIKAVSTGKVIWYDSYKGIGKVVLIEGDNGYDYLYGTNESLDVHMGVQISAGERLGRLKDSNTSMIFSVFKNGKPLSNISEAPR